MPPRPDPTTTPPRHSSAARNAPPAQSPDAPSWSCHTCSHRMSAARRAAHLKSPHHLQLVRESASAPTEPQRMRPAAAAAPTKPTTGKAAVTWWCAACDLDINVWLREEHERSRSHAACMRARSGGGGGASAGSSVTGAEETSTGGGRAVKRGGWGSSVDGAAEQSSRPPAAAAAAAATGHYPRRESEPARPRSYSTDTTAPSGPPPPSSSSPAVSTFLCGICNTPILASHVTSHLLTSPTWNCRFCSATLHLSQRTRHLGGCEAIKAFEQSNTKPLLPPSASDLIDLAEPPLPPPVPKPASTLARLWNGDPEFKCPRCKKQVQGADDHSCDIWRCVVCERVILRGQKEPHLQGMKHLAKVAELAAAPGAAGEEIASEGLVDIEETFTPSLPTTTTTTTQETLASAAAAAADRFRAGKRLQNELRNAAWRTDFDRRETTSAPDGGRRYTPEELLALGDALEQQRGEDGGRRCYDCGCCECGACGPGGAGGSRRKLVSLRLPRRVASGAVSEQQLEVQEGEVLQVQDYVSPVAAAAAAVEPAGPWVTAPPTMELLGKLSWVRAPAVPEAEAEVEVEVEVEALVAVAAQPETKEDGEDGGETLTQPETVEEGAEIGPGGWPL